MESIDGKRPIQQLTRWTDEAVYRELARRADRNRTRFVVRPRVRAVRCCPAGPTATEASVVVQFGARVRAVAVRFEAAGGRWLCTAFELIEPRRSGPRRR